MNCYLDNSNIATNVFFGSDQASDINIKDNNITINMEKKLYRSRTDKMLAGVCGGIGAYLNIDPTVIRVIYVTLSVFSAAFPGLLLYIILAILMPQES